MGKRKQQKKNKKKEVEAKVSACFGSSVRRLNRVAQKLYDESLKPFGVTGTQYDLLSTIKEMIAPTQTDLGRALQTDISTLTRNLMRMRRAGWVSVSREGRSKVVALTHEGRATLKLARPGWKRAQKDFRKLVGRKGAEGLEYLVDRVI